jgi:hypothetical protein
MLNPYRARVNERAFLNLPGFHGGAYVLAYVEDTSSRTHTPATDGSAPACNFEPRLILEIADCNERINLEFDLHTPLQRKNSFHKIDTLIAALQTFRTGLAAECEQYRKRRARLEEAANETARY